MSKPWTWRSSDVQLARGVCHDEVAFRHLLGVERQRAARAGRSFLLLKVSVRAASGTEADLTPGIAAHLWTVLRLCTRDVDFVGWYRAGQVTAAVLSQGREPPSESAAGIQGRVIEALRARLSAGDAGRLAVDVLQVRPVLRA